MDIQPRSDPVARARELGAQIAAAADEIERTQRIPEALLNRLHDSRLFRMLLPRSSGGDETARGLCGGDRGTRPARRFDRVECVRRQQFLPDRRLPGACGQSSHLRRSAQYRGLGTSKRFARESG
jgi:hypothetical protein